MRLILKSPAVLIKKRGIDKGGKGQRYVDSECLRLMARYTPLDTGALIKSATIQSVIGSGTLKQSTPYAKRWYYRPANFSGAPERGNRWFERMKDKHWKEILAGARKISGVR